MKVVIVSETPCHPPTAGNRIRIVNLMRPLARRHDVTFVSRGSGHAAETRRAEEFLRAHGIRPITVEDAPASKTGLALRARMALNLASSVPYSVATHNSPALRRAIQALAAREAPDLWQFEWWAYVDALPPHPRARAVVVAHDVLSLMWRRHRDAARNPLARWYIEGQRRRLERCEGRAFARASRVVAVSATDAEAIRRLYGVRGVDVVENGVDNAYFADVSGPRDPDRILFLGTLQSRPNLDGVEVMLERVFPRVRAQRPQARLVIVGSRPPASLVARVRDMANVELHADVPDVRPFVGRCGVMAVPLRIGSGSRLKILEALSAGLPVVSTRIGAEGLDVQAPRDLVVVDGVDDLAAPLVEALDEPERAQQQARSGQRVVRDRYGWEGLADKLEQVWESCVATPATRSVSA